MIFKISTDEQQIKNFFEKECVLSDEQNQKKNSTDKQIQKN